MADSSENPLKRLIAEIHRRSLWQVLGIYAVASWAVLGGVSTPGDLEPYGDADRLTRQAVSY